jgi:hypothetical protein
MRYEKKEKYLNFLFLTYFMAGKHIVVKGDTLVLLNRAKSKYLNQAPEITNLSDDFILKIVLKKYVEG